MRVKITGTNKSNSKPLILKIEDDITPIGLLTEISDKNTDNWDLSTIQSIRYGYPPKLLDISPDNTSTLKELGVANGDNLIISFPEEIVPISVSQSLTRHEVPDDNSCMFHSISYILTHSLVRTTQLRELVSQSVLESPMKFNAAILGQSTSDYARWIKLSDTWGGAIELSILCSALHISILVIDASDSSLPVNWFEEENAPPPKEFCCVLYTGVHYDPLQLNNKTTCFPYSDENKELITRKARALAQGLRSTNQTFNVSKEKIVCNICGATMFGEREAGQHAEKTGHVDMQQAN